MANMQPGTYRARIENYTISTTKSGNPQVEVLFTYHDGPTPYSGTPHQVRWYGHMTEKALPYTLKTLAIMGCKAKTDEDFAKLADGIEGGILDHSQEVDLVLDWETNPNNPDKPFLKVQWINDPNRAHGGGFKNALNRGEARVKLGAMNLAGQMALVRAELESKSPKAKTQAPVPVAAMREPGEDLDDFDFGV
jgi:hypothetical protein